MGWNRMRGLCVFALVIVLAASAVSAGGIGDFALKRALVGPLDGFQEVPALVTAAHGVFRAVVANDNQSIEFVLHYNGLPGPASAAHIHIGQRGVNGAIAVNLCGTAGTPACPEPGERLQGTITADDVVDGASGQGVGEGQIEQLIHAMTAGVTYVNVHTPMHPAGEIRGQLGLRNLHSLFPTIGAGR